MKQKTVYVFGNEYLSEDGFARVIARGLEGVQIVHATTPDVLLDAGKEITILDVVKNISEPILIKEVSQLKTRKLTSLHDFDVGFFLTLMERMGLQKKIKIIGIPPRGDVPEITKKVRTWLSS